MSEDLPKIYICSDGIIIWYGKRGINNRITYQSYSFGNEKIINKSMKQKLKELKERT